MAFHDYKTVLRGCFLAVNIELGERLPITCSTAKNVSSTSVNETIFFNTTMFNVTEKSNGQTGTKILLEAMSKDKVHLVKFILDALDGKIIDSKTEGAQTPLISSVLLPDSETRCKFMELLIQKGASVNCQDESGRTALSYASEKGYLDAVKILVRHNADPEMIDLWGNTALMYAVVAGHSPVLEFLVRAFKRLGLQIDRQNKVGNSAVEVAKYLGHTDCIFALTSNPKKVREFEESKQTDFSDCGVNDESVEGKLNPLVKRHEILQTGPTSDCSAAVDATWHSRTTGRGRNSLILKSRLQSMDSIEEYDRENERSPSSPQDLIFSGVLTPRPPHRTCKDQTCTFSKLGEKKSSDGYLPHLTRGNEHQMSVLYSPRPAKNPPRGASATPTSSTLGILLTPITGKNVRKGGPDQVKLKPLDPSVRIFDESYYQKRCSLPSSILSPTPPDRSSKPLRKSKTLVWRHGPTVVNTDSSETTAPVATSTTFSVLGNRLLRRFTFPEFKKVGKESQQQGACDSQGGDPSLVSSRGIPRSEMFPLSTRHPQVGSKPSIDSISAVKCEFDFHFRTSPPE